MKHDASPALRDLAPLPGGEDEEPGPPRDLLENRPTHAHGYGPAVTDPVVQSTAPGGTAPSNVSGFAGAGNLDGVYPPDTNGDVGPNDYVQWVNLHFTIYSKTGAIDTVRPPATRCGMASARRARRRTPATRSCSTTSSPTAG